MFFVPDKETGEMLIQMASRRLARIGLNINQKKVLSRTLRGLYTYRSFAINDLFNKSGANRDSKTVQQFAKKTFSAVDINPTALKDRGYPLIKRLVTADYNLLDKAQRSRLMTYVFNEDFIKSCRAYNLGAAYEKMTNAERIKYINLIDDMVAKSKHSAFHYEILAFYRRVGLATKILEDRIAELRKDIYEVI